MLAKLTLLGLHKFSDGSIWDDLEFPEGIDKDTAVNEILRQCSEFCVLYPDLEFLKNAIPAWGRKWYFTFEKWITVINTEYEPLWNLDVKISIGDDGLKSGSNSKNTSGTTGSTVTSGGTNTHQNSAYDSDEFKNAEKDTRADSSTASGSSSGSESGSFSETDKNQHEEYRRGNQGITKSQDMLMDELNVRTWNLYSHIADIFANEFCITLYV